MAWSIYQMKQIILPFIVVYHTTRLCFDRDTPLPLHVEFVQKLLLASRFDCACELEEPVAEGALAMIDVGDNAEVPEPLKWYL